MTAPSTDTAGIRQTVRALRDAGWNLHHVYDGEDNVRVRTEREAIDAITAVDAAHLYVVHPTESASGWVHFVMGNDPEEVVCDYTLTLSDVVDPLTRGWWS